MAIPVGAINYGYFDASSGVLPPVPSAAGFWFISTAGTLNNLDFKPNDILVWTPTVGFYPELGLNDWGSLSSIPKKLLDILASNQWKNEASSELPLPNTLAKRDTNGDIEARMVKATYPSQTAIPLGSSVAFRVNSTEDNFLRTADVSALIKFLGRVNDSALLEGLTADQIRESTRKGLVLDTLTINNKTLQAPFSITKADVGLGDTPNYPATNSCVGTSTSLLASQRAAYNAASAPLLDDVQKRPIFITEDAPTVKSPDGIHFHIDKTNHTFQLVLKYEDLLYTS